MTRSTLGGLLLFLLAFSVPLAAQIQPIPNLNIQPIPIPGGDLVPMYGIVNSFVPGPTGQTPPYDPIGAEPNVITNGRSVGWYVFAERDWENLYLAPRTTDD